jgi:hypothetical protein
MIKATINHLRKKEMKNDRDEYIGNRLNVIKGVYFMLEEDATKLVNNNKWYSINSQNGLYKHLIEDGTVNKKSSCGDYVCKVLSVEQLINELQKI